MSAIAIEFREVLDFILDHASEEEIDRIWQAAQTRQKSLRSRAAAVITVGQEVRLTGISPKYHEGLTGTVTKINGKHAAILLDERSTHVLRVKGARRYLIPPNYTQYEVGGIPLTTCRPV
jgi:hypothetical protein